MKEKTKKCSRKSKRGERWEKQKGEGKGKKKCTKGEGKEEKSE